MTWWAAEDDQPAAPSISDKARQRFDGLKRDARLMVPEAPAIGTRFRVRMPMSGWQVWRRVDKEWVELVEDRAAPPE